MKKLLLLGSLVVCLILMASINQAFAQEDESTQVHITITEDGKVTTDTTFELKEGQDPDMIKKMVHHLAGDDVWHVKSGDMCINLDSIKEAHGGGKVLVFKDEDGNVTVKELGDDDDHEIYLDHKGHGDHEIMIIDSDDEGETVQIKKMKKGGSHMMIISADEDMEWTEEDGEGDKDIKVVKKIRVEVSDESEDEVEKEVEVEVEVETTKEKKKK